MLNPTEIPAIYTLNKLDLLTLKNVRDVLVSGRPMTVTDQMKDWAGLVEAWLPGTEGCVGDVLVLPAKSTATYKR
ncbi:hypothetical protein [Peribacillus kribbensis]|uniref:hypothetical protein n=1 Tax=Peribacillus kribbensis TaxID=356658 RepID=UPI00041D30D4|nr:hypothetical protein [Peribacillus kribbensis]